MKRVITSAILGLLLAAQAINAQKEFKEQIKKEITINNSNVKNTLIVKNVFGSITVEGYSGNKILLEVDKTITAKTSSDLDLGKQELKVKVSQIDNKIFVHPDAPYIQIKEGRLQYNWCKDYEEPVYSHNIDFVIKIPKNLMLEVSTVNNGEVLVSNTRGSFIKANNVNGGVELKNITGQTNVHAINGPVNISYADNPLGSSKYYSLNGDINITYQKDLSAEIAFKSMNGELFTDFDIVGQYAKTSTNKSSKREKGKFKFESKPIIKIGEGNLFHEFETLNGDVIIKKI